MIATYASHRTLSGRRFGQSPAGNRFAANRTEKGHWIHARAIGQSVESSPAGRKSPARLFGVNSSNINRDNRDVEEVVALARELLQREGWTDLLAALPSATVPGAAQSRATVTLYRNHETGRIAWDEFTETVYGPAPASTPAPVLATVTHAATHDPASAQNEPSAAKARL
jgi:hypothetical protein